MVKNPPANARGRKDVGSIPGSGRSLGVGNDNLLQYLCLENSMDREAGWGTVHSCLKESDTHTHTHTHTILWKNPNKLFSQHSSKTDQILYPQEAYIILEKTEFEKISSI